MSPKIQHVGGTDDGHAVVFLHGVNGDGLATWTHRNGFCWPKALAAETGYTVYTVTYPAATNWGHAMPLQSRAHSLLDSLRSAEVLGDAELCLVGHSFGGIVAKQMVRHAADNSAAYGAFLEHLAGIAFVGTPHDGAGIATLGDLLRRELGSTVTLEDLRYASPLLLDLGQWFVNHQRANGPLCHALYETRPLRHRWLGPLRTIQPVSAASANPGLADTECVPVDADHSELAKPASSSSPQFRSVGRFLERAFEVPAKFARLPRQVAAVCYRLSEQGPEFLLVKAGRGHGWTFPKGHIEPKLTLSEAAAAEAHEEAGASGAVEERPFTHYVQRRLGDPDRERRPQDLWVAAFLLKVERADFAGAEKRREPQWFTLEGAKEALAKHREPRFQQEFARVLTAAAERIHSQPRT